MFMIQFLALSSIVITIFLHFQIITYIYNPNPQSSRNCPSFPKRLPDGVQDVRLFYHVGMIKNWEEIVHDQLMTLEKCGLAHYAKSFTITYTNGNPEKLKRVLDSFHSFAKEATKIKIEIIPGHNMIPWEGTIMNSIYDTCHELAGDMTENENESTPDESEDESVNKGQRQSVVVFYFHNKGASRYDQNWKKQLKKRGSYAYSLYWRKYLEYFTLERPNLCLTAFANGAYTCGPEFQMSPRMHYSGNFWSASCDYIVKSKDVMKKFNMDESHSYTAAEFWIGEGYNLFNEKNKFIGLIDDERNMYNELFYPSEYRLRDEFEAIEVVAELSQSQENNSDFTNILRPLTKREPNE